MSMQLQYSHTIQVYIVILWLEKIQPNVWKMQTRALFKLPHKGETGCARLGPGFDLIMQELGDIYHISKHSLSQVYNMHTQGK